jgi:D-alanine--poly(phosphoribitol) ligase subunit 1
VNKHPDPVDQFLAVAQAQPHHPAVVTDSTSISYGELAAYAHRIAASLQTTGEPHPRVAIALSKSAWAYAAMFGTLLAGGFYTPINLEHPSERKNATLARFAPHALIVDSADQADGLTVAADCTIITLAELPTDRDTNVPSERHDLAYVMFTSGSTGIPKGVMISRASLSHYVDWAGRAMRVTPSDRWSQHPNIAFDLSVLDIYGALCHGASLFPIVGKRDRLLPADHIQRHKLTIWNSVPSVVDLMSQARQLTSTRVGSLRLATFCGEPLMRAHLDGLFSAHRDLVVHNTYGPTEATVSMTLVELQADTYAEKCKSSAALGDAIDGMTIVLEGGPDSSEGEAIIVGPQVARGYWRDPDLTAEAFAPHWLDGVQSPAYRTGDILRRSDSDLHFITRADRQVKRHGYRLELGEVDSACRGAGARAACTILFSDRLIAFVEGVDVKDAQGFIRKLAVALPAYAVPEVYPLDSIPRNANDKFDAGALTALVNSELAK